MGGTGRSLSIFCKIENFKVTEAENMRMNGHYVLSKNIKMSTTGEKKYNIINKYKTCPHPSKVGVFIALTNPFVATVLKGVRNP